MIDADGDGVKELFVVGRTAALWRLSAPAQGDRSPVPLPSLRTRGVNDAAVGDQNRDGRPDVYLAIGPPVPSAST